MPLGFQRSFSARLHCHLLLSQGLSGGFRSRCSEQLPIHKFANFESIVVAKPGKRRGRQLRRPTSLAVCLKLLCFLSVDPLGHLKPKGMFVFIRGTPVRLSGIFGHLRALSGLMVIPSGQSHWPSCRAKPALSVQYWSVRKTKAAAVSRSPRKPCIQNVGAGTLRVVRENARSEPATSARCSLGRTGVE